MLAATCRSSSSPGSGTGAMAVVDAGEEADMQGA
jgi:hypothetical protein